MGREKFIKINPVRELKKRIQALKDDMPRNWLTHYVALFPEYRSEEGKKYVRRIYYGDGTDEIVTNNLEKLAQKLKKEAA